MLCKDDGRPIDGYQVNRLFTDLCRFAHVRRARFHDLRYTCAPSSWSRAWTS